MAKQEVKEWLNKADKDLDEAKFLLDNNRPSEDIAFFLHQAAEKYLKGFLLSNGWELEKIHDLVKLLKEAIKFDKEYAQFQTAAEIMTDFYIESRYPVGYAFEFEKEELKQLIQTTDTLGSLVKSKIL